ncbi:MAG: glycogen synthase GlgA [Dehalococcoidia bacterium]|nr:glycogen synthase GlgA [Dehalococcoidia bacterium]MDW8119781.1 glycogen synthase GlgA [Chloroflexota bacterium]
MNIPDQPLRVAMAAPEIAPFARTGGLGDVLGALPKALAALGVQVSLYMPAYRCVLQGGFPWEDTGVTLSVPLSGRRESAHVLRTRLDGTVPVYLVRADAYFDRDHLYGPPGQDYPDNAARFVVFSRAVLEALRREPPHILHCHDWQTALAIAFLKAQPERYPELRGTKTVFTVHNLGYQGLFWGLDWHLLELPEGLFSPRYLEFYGKINFLKGGLVFADALTTVSPTYAQEVQTPEYGFGLEGVFRERAQDLVGILNGVDDTVWDPQRDPFIVRRYGRRDSASGKAACKAHLQSLLGLTADAHTPLLAMVSRLTEQKGIDLVMAGWDALMGMGVQFVLLGRGEERYEAFFQEAAARSPGRVAVRLAFEDALAHHILAGADMLLMPSRYEPSGLTQMYALRYGTVPIVRATGGLKDTVQEFDPATGQGTGFLFDAYNATAMLEAVGRALRVYGQPRLWRALVRNGMGMDFSWERSARAYLALYERLVGRG